MNKTQKMRSATQKARKQTFKQWLIRVILFPWNLCKKIWAWFVRLCKRIWNWLKSIDIVGMINLTLLVAIIVLFSSLIADIVCCKKCSKNVSGQSNVTMVSGNQKNQKTNQRRLVTTLPVRADKKTGIKPKIKTVGVKKPQVIQDKPVSAKGAQIQVFSGDVIIDVHPSAPILYNGVKIDGNLFIQNMRKYTLPCGTKVNGNLFIRNVDKLYFCGDFVVNGNIYVNRQSSFGPIPDNARIAGNIIL